jgi:ABC-type uncharacterized transport system substrate-binding protein
MRRRAFIAMLGGAAAVSALPVGSSVAHAQQAMPRIGVLGSTSPDSWRPFVAAFLHGLRAGGFVEGKDVAIEYRWAEGRYERLPAFAAELVRTRVDVILAIAPPAALAAKAATPSIPIVFTSGGDPVTMGLVSSVNRPGGNLTGINFLGGELAAKMLETVVDLVPRATKLAILVNPSNPNSGPQIGDARSAAQKLGRQIQVLTATNEIEIEAAFGQITVRGIDALLVGTDAAYTERKDQLLKLSSRVAVPTVYPVREFVAAGGLLSYGTSLTEAYRQVGLYVARILKGAKPADLPIIQPTKFELVINLKTAKALGLEVPPTLLARADEVIE